jgi:hypothetical protein
MTIFLLLELILDSQKNTAHWTWLLQVKSHLDQSVQIKTKDPTVIAFKMHNAKYI